MLKARCPSCGKSASLDETDAGLPVVCLACGARYTAPDPIAEAAVAPAGAGGGAAAAAPVGSRRVGRTFWVAMALGGVAAVAALALVLRSLPDPIDRATAVSLASQAQAHAAEGRLADAHRKYHELETIVAGRRIRDAETRQLVEQAMAEKQRVYAALLDRVEQDKLAASRPAAASAEPVSDAIVRGGGDDAGTSASSPAAPSRSAAPAPEPVAIVPETGPSADEEVATASPPSPAPAPSGAAPVEVAAQVSAPPEAPAATLPANGPSVPTTQSGVAAAAPRPPIRPMPEEATGVTDEQIGNAIQKGVNYLLSRFDTQRHTLGGTDTGGADGGGLNALAVYALMQCGQAVDDERLNVRGERMGAMIEAMKESRLRRGHAQTYATGIRATALALFNRPQDRATLRLDVNALVQAQERGAYSYAVDTGRNSGMRNRGSWDNSNSQYGLLGVWSGAEAGVEVPGAYWALIEQHWTETQTPDGQWNYAGGHSGTIAMTAAGIASLFVAHDWLDAPKAARSVGRDPFSPALERGLRWFETGDNSINLAGAGYWGYTLYGIERVGLASGFKYFGQHDWYRHLAAETLARQASDGSWGDVVDTSFALLFLSRGRHPILMNKVRFAGYWANRPRDVANLSRFAARQLERELNWQVVPLRPPNEWTDWLDSPILYIASHKAPILEPVDYDNLRQFVASGGLLFTQADGDAAEVNKWAGELAAKLFPRYEMRDLPPDHAIYNLVYKIDEAERPPLKAVSNGARLLMVHSPTDLARAWQLRDSKNRKGQFHLGINLFLYAAGKRDLRNRLDSTFISDPGTPANGTVPVARLRYAGNWDPEPAAWSRFGRWMARQTGTGLDVSAVKLSELKPVQARVAHLTGTARHDFTEDEIAAAKAFVEGGGVLLIDQCGGRGPFEHSVTDVLLAKAFPDAKPLPLDPGAHPLFRGGAAVTGMDDLTKPKLRPTDADGRAGANGSAPITAFRAGKGHVIYTPLDVTSGLLGTRTWGIAGLHPDYAPAFVKNLIFWTVDGQKGE